MIESVDFRRRTRSAGHVFGAAQIWAALALVLTLTATVQAGTLTLEWDPNSEPDLIGYFVLYGTEEGVYPKWVYVGNETTAVIKGLPGGQVHYFVVQAYNGLFSPYSNVVSGSTTNLPPIITNPGDQMSAEGGVVSLPLTTNDPDGDPLFYTAPNLPEGLTIDPFTGVISGEVTYTAEATYNVTVTASDIWASAETTFVWTVVHVNAPPFLENPGNLTDFIGTAITLQLEAIDVDGDPLVYSAEGLPPGLSIHESGWIDGSPTTKGTFAVTASVSDGTLSTDEAFTWTVPNRAPTLQNPGNQSTPEGTPVSLQLISEDLDGDPRTYSSSQLPAGLSLDTTTGLISGTPPFTAAGSSFVILATSDGVLSATRVVNWTIVNVNTAPVLAGIGPQAVAEGQLLSLTISATDPQGDALIYSASGLPAGATFNPATQVFSWTPSYAQAGDVTVTFTVTDNGAGALAASEAVVITVTNANTAPVLAPIGAQTVGEGTLLSLTISATDPQGDGLTYSTSELPAGATFDTTTRVFGWTPSYTQAGTVTVTFTVTDDSAGALSASEAVVITVTDMNRPPLITQPPAQTSAEGAAVTLPILASDPDNDALSFSASGLPPGLSIHTTTGAISGMLPHTTVGAPVVTITVTDGGGLSAQTSFTWTVQPPQILANGVPSTGTLTVGGGALLTVALIGGPSQTGDWVGLYVAGGTLYQPIDWKYLDGTRNRPSIGLAAATVTFTAPLTPGSYQIRFYHSDTLDLGATSATVVSSVPTLAVNGVAPPTTVNLSAGTPLSVALTGGPGHAGDWVGLYAVGGAPYQPIDWKYLNGTRNRPSSGLTTATLDFTAPFTSGSYQMRFYHGDSINLGPTSTTIVVSVPTLAVNGVEPPATVNVSAGTAVSVTLTGGPGNSGDWVGLYPLGGPAQYPLDWKYLDGTRNRPSSSLPTATLSFVAPLIPGSYQLRFYHSDTLNVGATSPTIASSPNLAVNGVAPPATLNVSTGTVVSVGLTEGPGHAGDWVGLYPVGGLAHQPIEWKYLDGTQSRPSNGLSTATVSFRAPFAAGSYEVRFYYGDTLNVGATSATIVTSPPTLAVNGVLPPAIVNLSGGDPLSVAFTGAPGNVGDWLGLYPVGGAPQQPIDWKYLNGTQSPPAGSGLSTGTLSFTAPLAPGSYQIRFYHSGTLELGMTSATIVTSP